MSLAVAEVVVLAAVGREARFLASLTPRQESEVLPTSQPMLLRALKMPVEGLRDSLEGFRSDADAGEHGATPSHQAAGGAEKAFCADFKLAIESISIQIRGAFANYLLLWPWLQS